MLRAPGDHKAMTELKNDRLLRALMRRPVDKTPVWLMRQAGRYLPEYRATRKAAGSFLDLCKTPELACEVTLQPLRRFDLDAAILFSDILTIPDAMGLGLHFVDGEGPAFAHPLRRRADVENLSAPDPEEELRYVMDAARLVRAELAGRCPLIGFAGSPWTLAAYMIEGGGSKTFARAKAMLYSEPAVLHQLLEKLAQATVAYLNAQIVAGAQAVMLFDTWGGLLSTPHFKAFSLAYLERVTAQLTREAGGRAVPVIVFTKGGGLWLPDLARCGCDALGLDWTVPLGKARAMLGGRVALQGNLDPAALYAPAPEVAAAVRQILDEYGPGPGHVFNLGHGITPDVEPERVRVLVDTAHEYSARLHAE